MNKKYELTENTKTVGAKTLHQIRALRDFRDVKAGDLGGWLEKEENLSRDGSSWVYGSAQVYDNAWVCGDAQVSGGVWGKSPLYIQGTKWAFNIASDTQVRVGCQIHTWKEWHDNFRRIAAEHGGEDIISEYVQYFNLACRLYGHEDCLIEFERVAAE